MSIRKALFLVVAFSCGAARLALGQAATDIPAPEQLALYEEEILPILEQNCYECHGGEDEIKSGFNLTTRPGLLAGGERGAAIDLSNPGDSLLLEMLSYKDEHHEMPPSGQLLPWDIEALTEWVMLGAPYPPSDDPAPVDAGESAPDFSDVDHWAYQPVQRPNIPEVAQPGWQENPIDAFIYARLAQAGLEPSKPASKQALIRRAYYDLIGLPPTPAEVRAFVHDDSDEAFVVVVEHLLGLPQYGEKWGRHWLDLVRYADSNGYERDSDKPYMWRYRDYLIRSFNEDKPYDRFIREQIAGDEIPETDHDAIIGTGYYRLGLWDDEPVDIEQARFDMLDDVTDTTSRVFLATTMGCARCHDHKIDPIPQSDYYRFLAYFRGVTLMERKPGNGILASLMSPFEERVYERRVAEKRAEERALSKEIHAFERDFKEDLKRAVRAPSVTLKADDGNAALTEKAVDDGQVDMLLNRFGKYFRTNDEIAAYHALQQERGRVRGRVIPGEWAAAVQEVDAEAPQTNVLIRGNPHVPGEEVSPGVPLVLGGDGPDLSQYPGGDDTSGRRSAVADWIASPGNPLTARVMVNRIWQFHFGRGLVRTPSDFGFQGARPTHPELLDWLAAEFVARGWSVKEMHRLIMSSRTWQMSSRSSDATLAQDPENDLFWRFNMRRLTAEEIRDSVLAVSGALNPKMYGPGFYPALPKEALSTSSMSQALWHESPPEEQGRRSIYIHVRRSLLDPLLADFDLAETDSSCPARFSTTQPTQSLNMLNSAFANTHAERLAERLRREAGEDPAARVRLGLNLVTQRDPAEWEVDEGLAFVDAVRSEEGLDAGKALTRYCLVLLNLNEFVYVD